MKIKVYFFAIVLIFCGELSVASGPLVSNPILLVYGETLKQMGQLREDNRVLRTDNESLRRNHQITIQTLQRNHQATMAIHRKNHRIAKEEIKRLQEENRQLWHRLLWHQNAEKKLAQLQQEFKEMGK